MIVQNKTRILLWYKLLKHLELYYWFQSYIWHIVKPQLAWQLFWEKGKSFHEFPVGVLLCFSVMSQYVLKWKTREHQHLWTKRVIALQGWHGRNWKCEIAREVWGHLAKGVMTRLVLKISLFRVQFGCRKASVQMKKTIISRIYGFKNDGVHVIHDDADMTSTVTEASILG